MSGIFAPIILGVVVFVGILFFMSRTSGSQSAQERLRRMEQSTADGHTSFDSGSAASTQSPDFLEGPDEKSGMAMFGEQLLRMLGKDVGELERAMQLTFVQAGIYSSNALAYFYLFRFVTLPLAIVMIFIVVGSHAEGMMRLAQWCCAFILLFIGFYGPNIYIANNKAKRQKVLGRSFPDTLDLVLVCVESGLALDAALARVCRELGRAHPEITKELNRTRMELTLLSDRSQALQNLAERTDMVAFRSLVAALLQTEKFGTSLTETLRVLSDDYRHSRLMAAENKAGRLPAMMTIPMILLMMPSLMLIILGPAGIKLIDVLGSR